MEKFLIIDGNSLINRAFYALPLLSNEKGEFSNAVYGFTTMLIKAITEHAPTHIAVAFDYGKKTFRNELFAEYKGTRKETPDELKSQFDILKRVLSAMNIKLIEQKGIEADDILGTMCKSTDVKTIILSGDRDVFQLIDDSTEVWFTRKGLSEVETLDQEKLKEFYGLEPSQIIDSKALSGDSSDNIPGVRGIGEKTCKMLLEKYHDIDGIYEHINEISGSLHDKLVAGRDMAYLSKKLATIKTDCPINFKLEECTYDFPFKKRVYDIFSEYEFKSLLKKKELFETDVELAEQQEIPCETIIISNKQKLHDIMKYVYESKVFAFRFTPQIEFAFSDNFRYVVKAEITLFDSLTNEEIFEEILPILQDEKIEKITFDMKANMHICHSKFNGNVFDIAIAKYLLGENNNNFEINTFFNVKKILFEKMKLLGVLDIYSKIEIPLVEVLYDMENYGFKIDKKMLFTSREELIREKNELTDRIYKMAGQNFNINSPKQLQIILFDELKLHAFNNKKRSTNIDVLNELEDKHPIISLLLKYRKLQKILSTYIDVYVDIVNKSGDIIHTLFNQTLTSTGRLSSSEPNLQNIPIRSEEGKVLRKLFISRFEGGSIMSADYNQIELRLLANFSGDKTLIESYKSSIDIHTTTAGQIFNKPISDITPDERRTAKAVNFGVIYGISDYGLSQNIHVSRKSAKEYIDAYFAKYPMVKTYMDENVQKAIQDGYVKTIFGRIRRIPELASSNMKIKGFGARVAMNMPLQGSASDIIKIAMLKTQEQLKKQNLKSLLILTIHDELILDVYPGEEIQAQKLLKSCMENVISFEVPLMVDITYGKTWFEAK